jgi:transcriptional regulator with XRE-family HTH domain
MASPQVRAVVESIGANARRWRERRNLTQAQLAERGGFDIRYYRFIERGRTNLTIEALVRLAGVLGVEPAALLRKAKLRPGRVGRPPQKASGRKTASGAR